MDGAEIKADLVDQFGPGVLAEPPKYGFDLLAWLLPLGLLVAGALGVGGSRGGGAVDATRPTTARLRRTALDPELERRLDAELERFDA